MPPRDYLVNAADTVLSANLSRQLSKNSAKYRFPIDYEGEYGGSITFTAVEEKFVSLEGVELNWETVDQALEAGRAQIESMFGSEEVQTVQSRKFEGDTKGSVSLYLPTSLQFTDGIEYSNIGLNAAGAIAEGAMRSGNPLAGVAATLQDMPLLDVLSRGVSDPAGQLALQRVLAKTPFVGGEQVTNVASLTSGLTLNPNTRSLLRGVSLRRFRFQFNLIPTSEEESRAIKNIIYFFRTSMYPEDVAPAGIPVGYKFPYKFVINMRYRGKKVATGILPCFLENFDTNYNPNSMGMMKDGNFPEVTIAMSFIESRTLRKTDIEGGY